MPGHPRDARPPRQLQGRAGVPVHEQQPDAGIHRDVAEGLEHVVAGVIGEPQPSVAVHTHEARLAAAVRRIRPGALVKHSHGDWDEPSPPRDSAAQVIAEPQAAAESAVSGR